MKSLIYKDKLNRKNFSKNEKNFKLNKLIKKNDIIFDFQKLFILYDKNIIVNNIETRLKNRCTITGRSRSVSRDYRLSRIKFRELGREGFITGLKKSSW
jgi:small subunit ribosomal protein S14